MQSRHLHGDVDLTGRRLRPARGAAARGRRRPPSARSCAPGRRPGARSARCCPRSRRSAPSPPRASPRRSRAPAPSPGAVLGSPASIAASTSGSTDTSTPAPLKPLRQHGAHGVDLVAPARHLDAQQQAAVDADLLHVLHRHLPLGQPGEQPLRDARVRPGRSPSPGTATVRRPASIRVTAGARSFSSTHPRPRPNAARSAPAPRPRRSGRGPHHAPPRRRRRRRARRSAPPGGSRRWRPTNCPNRSAPPPRSAIGGRWARPGRHSVWFWSVM